MSSKVSCPKRKTSWVNAPHPRGANVASACVNVLESHYSDQAPELPTPWARFAIPDWLFGNFVWNGSTVRGYSRPTLPGTLFEPNWRMSWRHARWFVAEIATAHKVRLTALIYVLSRNSRSTASVCALWHDFHLREGYTCVQRASEPKFHPKFDYFFGDVSKWAYRARRMLDIGQYLSTFRWIAPSNSCRRTGWPSKAECKRCGADRAAVCIARQ